MLEPDQQLILEHVVARLIPNDELGPGAREAGVAVYIARMLGEHEMGLVDTYAHGLAALDAHARSVHGTAFVDLSAAHQDTELRELEREAAPFFELLLRHTREGMFGDPHWGGNADGAGWSLLDYPGPRAVWTERDQALSDIG
jgi:gluconate 2-dehydrogenase gamma chain